MDGWRIENVRPDAGKHFSEAGATGGLILLVIVVIIFAFVTTIRVGRVTGEEVGVMLNKVNGKMTIIPESGVRVYNGLTHRLYVLDKTLQTLDMSSAVDEGDRHERDDIKIKTSDGSDVYVDLKVQYRVIVSEADTVLATSGPGDAFKEKWARDFVRSASRNFLGELTTEGFYDAAKRNGQVAEALSNLRDRLLPFGIQIDSIVLPTRPRFYEEYENMIKKKKLADQQALEEESKAEAAKQRQETEVVEATNKKNVALEEFKGRMQQLVIEAEAQAEKTQKEADAYFDRVTIGAEASLYQKRLEAEGILAQRKAEAQGLEALQKALTGEGGRNMVKLEYAKALRGISIVGQPYATRSLISRFEHAAVVPGMREVLEPDSEKEAAKVKGPQTGKERR